MRQSENAAEEGRVDLIRLRTIGHVGEEQVDFEWRFERVQSLRPNIQRLSLQIRRQQIEAFVVDGREFTIAILIRVQHDRPTLEASVGPSLSEHICARSDDVLMPGMRLTQQPGELLGPDVGAAPEAVLPPRILNVESFGPVSESIRVLDGPLLTLTSMISGGEGRCCA